MHLVVVGDTGFARALLIRVFASMKGVVCARFPFLKMCHDWKSSELKLFELLYFEIEANAAIFSIFVAVLCQFAGILLMFNFLLIVDEVSVFGSSFTFPLSSEFLEDKIFALLLRFRDRFGF